MTDVQKIVGWALWSVHQAAMIGAVRSMAFAAKGIGSFFDLYCAVCGDAFGSRPGPMSAVYRGAIVAAQNMPIVLGGVDDAVKDSAPLWMLLAAATLGVQPPAWALALRASIDFAAGVVVALALLFGVAVAVPALAVLLLAEAAFVLAEATSGRGASS